jgi:flagellar biosynthesis protein FlhG
VNYSPKIIPIASGKGGVGKSLVALNLACALTLSGKTVILADFDLGGATQHLLLGMGIKGNEVSLGQLVHGKENKLENLVKPTPYRRLYFISGDAMLPGTSHLSSALKSNISRQLRSLVADYIIIDLGAGSSYTVTDFYLSSYGGLIVVNPEITSIMAAYSFMKTVLFRALYGMYPAQSTEREMILKFVRERIEGLDLSFDYLLDKLSIFNKEAGERVRNEIAKLNFKIVFNMLKNNENREWEGKLLPIVKRKLGRSIEVIAYLNYSESVSGSVIKRVPLLQYNSADNFSKAVIDLAKNVSLDENRALWQAGFNLKIDDETLLLKPKF